MIELLTTGSGKPPVQYPDSGPGPITLSRGDETFGLFGTLSAADVFTSSELVTLTKSPANTSLFNNWVWVKMMVDKQVLFIPHSPVSTGGSWDGFYKQGLVYGDGTDGKYPSGAAVKQNNIIKKGNTLFRVRLFGKGDPDPATVGEGANYVQPLKDFELGRFIAATYYGNYPELANSWRLFPFNSGVTWTSRIILTIPSRSGNLAAAQGRYLRTPPSPETTYYAKTATNTSMQWWPVLEVMPADTLFGIDTVSNSITDETVPSPVAITSTDYEEATEGDMLKGISLRGLRYDTTDPKAVAITSLDYEA